MPELQQIEYSRANADELKALALKGVAPFLLRGVPLPAPEIYDTEVLRRKYMNPNKRGLGWYNTALPPVAQDVFNTPPFVRSVLEDTSSVVRPNPVRLWLQPNGHKTLMHYDGNSISGLNLQLAGRKHWTLVSPHTPLPCASFNKVAAIDHAKPQRSSNRIVFECETGPADMIFVPRYWFHQVETLAPVNVNVNWVWTPTWPDTSTPIGLREARLLRLLRIFPVLNKFSFGAEKGYGGGDASLVDTYVGEVSASAAILQLLREFAALPRTAIKSRHLLDMVRRFRRNNFGVGN